LPLGDLGRLLAAHSARRYATQSDPLMDLLAGAIESPAGSTPDFKPARSVTPVDRVHESICTIARHEQFAHPADAADEIAVNGAAAEGWTRASLPTPASPRPIRKAPSSASSKALWPRSSPASITVRVSCSSISPPCERTCAGAGTDCAYGMRPSRTLATRDRARWRGGAAAELPVMRSRVDPPSPEACRLG
jgi:hypothetical protein